MNKQPEVRARTRQKLMDAFWALSDQKNITQITVGELVRLAGYNRSTFYEYFTDMPDLIRRAEEELLDEVKRELLSVAPSLMQRDSDRNADAFRTTFHILNEPMYCLLGQNGDPSFISRLKDAVLPPIAEMLGLSPDSAHFGYEVAFICSAMLGFLQYWHEQGENRLPEEELFQLGHKLMTRGVIDVMSQPPAEDA